MMYRVVWEVDIDADSPKEAARIALDMQRSPESIALVFYVRGPGVKTTIIDLWGDAHDRA